MSNYYYDPHTHGEPTVPDEGSDLERARDRLRQAQREAEAEYAAFKGSRRLSSEAGYWKGLATAYRVSAGELDLILNGGGPA